jgi:hypothetical protein
MAPASKLNREELRLQRLYCLDRNKKDNFIKYMNDNPYYFKNAFPGMNVEDAWKLASKLRVSTDLFTMKGIEQWQEL